MLIKIHAVIAASALTLSSHGVDAQAPVKAAVPASTFCRHCDRPTPFAQTQGVSVVVMVRDTLPQPTMAAVIRDEPGQSSKPLIALKRSAITPALVYRALSSISQSRKKYNGAPASRATNVLASSARFEAVPDADRDWVARLIQQLSTAPMTDIAGVGQFPAVTFALDQKALRGK
jgi:hypothetical protein